jgi:hypothetical protein
LSDAKENGFFPQICEKYINSFQENSSGGSRVILCVRADGQTDSDMMKLTDAFRNSTNASNTAAIVITAISKRSKNTIKSSPTTHNVRVTAVVTFKITFRTISNSNNVEENGTVQADSDGMPGLLCGRTTY